MTAPFRPSSSRARRAGRAFARLVHLMETLRSPRGCPWDRQQTWRSLRPFLLEETYEALDAIDRTDMDALKGELGDVLFQCVFQAQLAAEARRFDIGDSIDTIVRKLIRRHPHVFTPGGRLRPPASRRQVRTAPAVVEQWEKIKAGERPAGDRRRLLDGIPRALPALARAHAIGTRTAAVGFDWDTAGDVAATIEEEARELSTALAENPERAAEELGDLLFSVANLARKLGLEPESALRAANDKFTRRFSALEAMLARRGQSVHLATPAELDRAWQAVKRRTQPPVTTVTGARSTSAPSTSRRAPSHRRSRRRSRRRDRS